MHVPNQLPYKNRRLLDAFEKVWFELHTSPVHLDALLSRQAAGEKKFLSEIIKAILRVPVSLGRQFRVEVNADDLWSCVRSGNAHRWNFYLKLVKEILTVSYSSNTLPLLNPVPRLEDFPIELLSQWETEWGTDVRDKLVEILGMPAPLTVRLAQSLDRAEVLHELRSSGLAPKIFETRLSPFGLSSKEYFSVRETSIAKAGALQIQDEGSQILSVFALSPFEVSPYLKETPGIWLGNPSGKGLVSIAPKKIPKKIPIKIIDACAGAGGKSLAIADLVHGKGRIYAYDVSEKKLAALRKRARTAGNRNIQTLLICEGNEEKEIKPFYNSADIVLVDAPCSGWGVLRRNPDIKWKDSNPRVSLHQLPLQQSRLLGLYSNLVRPGGRLVYGVCTFRKDETLRIKDSFLVRHPHFDLEAHGFLGPGECDGFYMAAFRRTHGAEGTSLS